MAKTLSKFLTEGKYDYKIYHTSLSDAMREMEAYAGKRGFSINQDDYWDQVATGPKKPSEGKTNVYSLGLLKDGKEVRKTIEVQVYGLGRGKYELNMYIG